MKTTNLAKSLKRFGIQAAEYKRAPFGVNTFALSILPRHKDGVVTVNHGRAEVEVFGSRTKRQAAVSVVENGRVVTRRVKSFVFQGNTPTESQMERTLISGFPVNMNSSGQTVVWKVTDIKMGALSQINKYELEPPRYRHHFSGTVTATVKSRTINHFLIGMDETRNFISPLRKKATSVREAHKILKPELRRKSKRQGEWFFEPCKSDMCNRLDAFVKEQPLRVKARSLGKSTHKAMSCVLYNPSRSKPRLLETYARGFIQDDRPGHHAALFLPTWHKVVRNREIAIKANASARRRSYD